MSIAEQGPSGARLIPRAFADLPFWDQDDHAAALACFQQSARHERAAGAVLRQGLPPDRALKAALDLSLNWQGPAKRFFESHFTPFEIIPDGQEDGFVTGYYEPEIQGSVVPHPDYPVPVLGRPPELVTVPQGEAAPSPLDPSLQSYNQTLAGLTAPPDRAAIEDGFYTGRGLEIAWLRDRVDLFFVQVQGSARLRLPNGSIARLVYAGRNGYPYTSIGRVIVAEGHLPLADAHLGPLKNWLRRNQAEARRIMRLNQSYIFFALKADLSADQGPIGAAGHSLSPLRSIAVDRTLWSYGTPFFISTDLDRPLHRLFIAQDTGSAIIGPARADLFFGSGEEAGLRAGRVRHRAKMILLRPRIE